MFDVDFRKAIYNLLPHFLRGEKNLAWLYSIQQPLKALNTIFVSFRTNTLYRLQFTAQIIYLEHYLNDQFDQVGRGIFIDNIEETDFTFTFNKIEEKPALYYYNDSEAQPAKYLYNTQELLEGENYIVKVPVAVTFDELVMRSKIDFYNNAGKNYLIETY
jgi:hypothetical protein